MSPAPRRPAVADLRTSEVMRRCASLLSMFADDSRDSDLLAAANELQLRARWIEVARHDEAVSEERRLGVAAIEDAGDRP